MRRVASKILWLICLSKSAECIRLSFGVTGVPPVRGTGETPVPPAYFFLSVYLVFAGLHPSATRAAADDDWKFDILRLKNGAVFKGVVVGETATEVRFRNVRRAPGTPTVVIPPATFSRAEIAALDKLGDKDRALLLERLNALDPTGKEEAARMDELELKQVPWVGNGGGTALGYASTHFFLISNAREDIVRRAAVRLEQIYGAYTRFLPPRHQEAAPTKIVLVRSLAEYHALLQGQGANILNPAFFDARRNQVVCASDLQKIGDELAAARKHHADLDKQVQADEAKFKKQFRGTVPAQIRNALAAKRKEIREANAKNDAIFYAATRDLFETLYHEAFHAYLANFVYTASEAAVPRWLNEGLAQIFETALVEAGELRVGHADKERLAAIKDAARKGELLPLTELLNSEAKQFLVAHAGEQHVSDRHYLNSWAVAFYLTFDRKLLATPEMNEYVRFSSRGRDALEAFRELVGKPLPQFEREFREFVRDLRADGTSASRSEKSKPR